MIEKVKHINIVSVHELKRNNEQNLKFTFMNGIFHCSLNIIVNGAFTR